MTFLQTGLGKAAGATGYQIARSLRFNGADSAYLTRTPSVAGNQQKWTYSAWIKRSALTSGSDLYLFAARSGSPWGAITFSVGSYVDTLQVTFTAGTAGGTYTTQVFRDLSSWYHIVVAVDTTQATAANRLKVYVNGSQITAFAATNYPTQNSNTQFNNTIAHYIGASSGASEYFSGYMAETYFIDGQQLDPTSFGSTDTNTGVWMPKQVTGMTYGTNGFYLNFSDNSNTTAATLGKDSSGNSNNWTPNNFSVTAGTGNDSLVDTPTNYGTDTGVGGEVRGNYATLNPLDNALTLANGNLQASGGSSWSGSRANFAVSSGKWYWECQLTSSTDMMTGLTKQGSNIAASNGYVGNDANGWGYNAASGQKYIAGGAAATYGASWVIGDIIGLAFDADTGSITCYKNNTSQGVLASGLTNGPYFPSISLASSSVGYVNFGQRPFAYTAPSGFKALCTQNLPTPAIGATSSTLANKNFDIATYTGTGSSLSVTSLAFQPDFTWVKGRSGATDHALYDAVRGVQKDLVSNSTAAETTQAQGVTAFGSTGFTVGTLAKLNTSSATYVGWNWKGANTTVSNTSGSITSTVSANTTAGFSVVSWTSNAAGAIETMGHGLGVTPALVICKNRDYADWWLTWHKDFSNTTRNYLQLNTTGAVATAGADYWAHTSTVLGIRQSALATSNGQKCIAYVFAEVAGFSKFSSYAGNGSTDGTFVYCGFRPRYVMIKVFSGTANSWVIYDSVRATYNANDGRIYPDLSNAEGSGAPVDFLSNGFKLRTTDQQVNGSGSSYIFAAFAESPFNYARAR
jgi:hypothetical protein